MRKESISVLMMIYLMHPFRFHEWVEFSPYEVALPKYGCSVPLRQFGGKFYFGLQQKEFEELPLHYMQGKLIDTCTSMYS